MKKTIYTCDYCQKELQDNKNHIRILRAEIRKNREEYYPIINIIDEGGDGIHFCNSRCLSAYFSQKINETQK